MTTSDRAVLRLRPDRTQRLEALLLGAGPHLEPVLDVGTATNGDLLVELPLPAARLTALLEPGDGLTAGEAVTVLAPLAESLGRMHDAGVAHGGVRAAAVVLDEDGSPAWTAPVAPTLERRVGPVAFAAQVAEDLAGYRALVAGLLAPAGAGLRDGLDLEGMRAALFALARPEPVRLVRPSASPILGTPSRLLPAVPVDVEERTARPGLVDAVRRQVLAVRVRVWGALGAAVALLVFALTVLPSGGAAPAAVPDRPATGASATRAPATSAPVAHEGPVAGRSVGAAAAITALVRARDACLAAGSEACIRQVDAVGSPVLDADLGAVRAGADGAGVDARRLRVTATTGDTALATAGGGTVLAIRDRDGWRLRDVVAEPPVDG